jgi:hypothetical protein
MCKATHCQKSHQEWFEIDQKRAVQVLSDWAEFMKRAKPYDERGLLKKNWRDIICMMDDSGLLVTSKRLLEHHKASLYDKLIPLDSQEDLGAMPKSEEEIGFADGPNAAGLAGSKKPSRGQGTQQIRQLTLGNETPICKTDLSSKQLVTAEYSPLDGGKNVEEVSLLDRESVSKTESKTEISVHSLPQNEQILQKAIVTTDSPLEGHQPAKIELVYEEVLPLEKYPMRRKVLPQIIQPSLLTLQSTTVPETNAPTQETKETPCSGGEESRTTNVISESNIDGIFVHTKPASVRSPTPVSGPTMAVLADGPSEKVQTEVNIEPDVSINATLLLDTSGPSPKPEPPDSPTSSGLSNPQDKTASNPPGQLDREVLEKIISHSSPKEEKEADAIDLIVEQWHIGKKEEQTRTERDALDVDEKLSEKEVEFENQDETTVTQQTTGIGMETKLRGEGPDAEEGSEKTGDQGRGRR